MSSAGATKATSSRHPRKSGYFITINQLPRLQTLQAINHSHRKVRKLRPIPRAHLQDGSRKPVIAPKSFKCSNQFPGVLGTMAFAR